MRSKTQGECVLLNRELAAIFGKIGSRENSQVGLKELHEFITTHPEVDLQPRLEKSSPLFQKFIKRSLDEIRAREREAQSSPQITKVVSRSR